MNCGEGWEVSQVVSRLERRREPSTMEDQRWGRGWMVGIGCPTKDSGLYPKKHRKPQGGFQHALRSI